MFTYVKRFLKNIADFINFIIRYRTDNVFIIFTKRCYFHNIKNYINIALFKEQIYFLKIFNSLIYDKFLE